MSIQSVTAVIDGITRTLTYNNTSGKWEATINAPSKSSYNQSGHYYDVSVTATDNAGNSAVASASTPGAIGTALQLNVKEKVKPTIAITSPSANALITSAAPPIKFTLRDDDSGIKITTLKLKIDNNAELGSTSAGMVVTPAPDGYDVTYTPTTGLGDGAHTIVVNVSDNDGNAATAATSTFTIDTVPPALDVTAPTDNFVTNKTAMTVTGTTSDVTSGPVTVTIKLNNVDQGVVTLNGSAFSKVITLAEGANTIIITSTDRAGKTTTITRTGTVSTSAPKFTAVTLTPNPVDAGATFVITVQVT